MESVFVQNVATDDTDEDEALGMPVYNFKPRKKANAATRSTHANSKPAAEQASGYECPSCGFKFNPQADAEEPLGVPGMAGMASGSVTTECPRCGVSM